MKGLALISIQVLSGKTIFLNTKLTLAFLLNHLGFSTFITSATIFVPQGSKRVPSLVYNACGTTKLTNSPAFEHFEKYFSSKTNCKTLPFSITFLKLVIVTTLQGAFL